MANFVNMARGGTPVFSGMHCATDWPEYGPAYNIDMSYRNNALTGADGAKDGVPPYVSHACAAQGWGWLNLATPLVPFLDGTDAHEWQRRALKDIKDVGDEFMIEWVPTRSFVTAFHAEVTFTDSNLDGVYVTPVAWRFTYNATTDTFDKTLIADFVTDIAKMSASVNLPLGTPASGDPRDILAIMSIDPTKRPSTWGTTIPGHPANGTVGIGWKVAAGDPAKIAKIHEGNFGLFTSLKLVAFECGAQKG